MLNDPVVETEERLSSEGFGKCRAKLLPAGTLLISIFATIGRTAILGVDATTNQAIVGVTPKENVDLNVRFLRRYLDYSVHKLIAQSRGVAQNNINGSILKATQIPLLPLKEQDRIAGILDKADSIRRKRQLACEVSCHLIDVVFHHFFGDCNLNAKQFTSCDFELLCDKIVDCPHSTPAYADTETKFACIRSSDLQDGYVNWDSTKYVNKSEYQNRIARHTPVAGEVVYTREGGRLGNAAQIPAGASVCLGQRIMLFSARHGETTNEYIWALLNTPGIRHQVRSLTAGAAAPRVNIKDLKRLKAFLPPYKLQQQFTLAVRKIEALRQEQIDADAESEDLFQSLVQRAFRGEF